MRKLHEIEKDITLLADIAEAGDFEAATKFATELGNETEEKLSGYYHVIKAFEAEILQAEETIKTAQAFKDRKAKAIEFLEARIKGAFRLLNLKKIDRPDARITMVDGRECLRRAPVEQIPAAFKAEDPQPPKVVAEEIAKLEGRTFDPESFSHLGCRVTRGDPWLKYPKLTSKEE
jgi:hypothetical protein